MLPLAGVRGLVDFQHHPGLEALRALRTAVRALVRVVHRVQFQPVRRRERLRTALTAERPHALVHGPHVLVPVVGAPKLFSTTVTRIYSPVRAGLLMVLEIAD